MTKSSTLTLEPFDLEIERIFRRLRNLVEARVSPKKEKPIIEETLVIGAANMVGVGNCRWEFNEKNIKKCLWTIG